jgi:hypothetical protein
MIDIVLRGVWAIGSGRPVAFHHLVRHATKQSSIRRGRQLGNIVNELIIKSDPIHFAVRPCNEAIE